MALSSLHRQNDELAHPSLRSFEDVQSRLDQLSLRESSVLELSLNGRTDEQIAQYLNISRTTVNSYWARIRGKLGQYSRTEMVSIVLRCRARQDIQALKADNARLLEELQKAKREGQTTEPALFDTPFDGPQRSSISPIMARENMDAIKGKRVLISGGTTGIGRATAALLAQNGARVYVFGRNEASVQHTLETVRSAGGEIEGSTADVGNRAEMEGLFARVDEHFGGIDILVNNAALPANNILTMEPEEWEQVIRVNVLGYMLCSRWAVRHMQSQGSGHIVGIGSLCIDVRDNGADVYVASKTAVYGFLHSLRKEVVDMGIKVTIINPGGTASNMVTETPAEQETMIAEGQLLRPEDVAPAVLYALSQPAMVDVTELTIRPHRQSLL